MALRRLLGFLFLSTLAWAAAFAQTYPAKPVRLIVAWAAGGTTDVAARIVAQKVSEGWPHQMVVENRPGAGGTIGAGVAAKASADGYTLLLGSSTEMVVSPHVYKNVSYSTVKDLVPVAYAGAQPMVLVVNPQVPAKSVRELIAYAKTRPNTLNSASAGNGSTLHLGQVLFESLAGVKFVHVPYAGSPQAAMGTVSGDAQVHFGSLSAVQELVRTGKLRGLATTGAKRAGSMADLPTLIEAGVPGYDLIIWNALFAPRGTPPEIINRVQADVNRALAGREAQDAFAKLSMDYSPMSGNDLSAMVSTDWSRLGQIVQSAGLKVD